MVFIYLLLFCSSLYGAPFDPYALTTARAGVNVAHAITNNNNGSRMAIGERISGRSFCDNSDKLKPGMWGTQGYAVRTQELVPVPLTDEHISTPCFVALKEQPDEEKIEMLKLAIKHPDGDPNYHIRRRNIAALVKIAKINPKVVQTGFRPDLLWQVTLKKDIALARLLLEAGADVHEFTGHEDRPTVIHFAKSLPFVQLLDEFGAFKHESASLLLHRAMDRDYDIALIPYYKEQYAKHNLNLLAVDRFKCNVLMESAYQISSHFAQEAFDKVRVLLQDLPDETALAMINYTQDDGENVMQYIQRQSEKALDRDKKVLASLKTLLQSRLDTICKKKSTEENKNEEQEVVDCAICLDPLAHYIVGVTKCCKQSLHGDCLQKWIALGHGCPLCRNAKPE